MIKQWVIEMQNTYHVHARYVFIAYLLNHKNYEYIEMSLRQGDKFKKKFKKITDRILQLYWENKLSSPIFEYLSLEESNLMVELFLEKDSFPIDDIIFDDLIIDDVII